MGVYPQLTAADIPTRTAARLSEVARATATRRPSTTAVPATVVVPANKLGILERARILSVVNSPRFVDLPPIQIYATLLDEGVYLASISTIYRVLAENRQVRERRRLARHPALEKLGFARTSSERATLQFTVPADHTIWATAASWAQRTNKATVDPVIAAWDVRRAGGPDADEAVQRIRNLVLAGDRS